MKTTLPAVLAALALGAAPSAATAQEDLRVALPESHELVELQPGLQVIPDFDLEVFFTGNAYWLRTEGRWYQARRPAAAATFSPVDLRSVPSALAKLPAGSHLHFKAAPGQRRSMKTLAEVETPEREPEVEIATPRLEQRQAPPPPQAAPAPPRAAPAKTAPARAAPAKKPAGKPAPLPRK